MPVEGEAASARQTPPDTDRRLEALYAHCW
jgi:hypothetical protein